MVRHHGLLMVIYMTPSPFFSNGNVLRRRRQKQLFQVTTVTDKPRKIYREILSTSRKIRIPTILQKIVTNICQDREAASIIAHQHNIMCYQNREFSTTSMHMNNSQSKVSISGEKRKKRRIFFKLDQVYYVQVRAHISIVCISPKYCKLIDS